MYFVKIVDDIAVLLLRSDKQQTDEGFYEISREQFETCTLPCRAEMTEEGLVLGEPISLDEIPQNGVACEPAPAPASVPVDNTEARLTELEEALDLLLSGKTEVDDDEA